MCVIHVFAVCMTVWYECMHALFVNMHVWVVGVCVRTYACVCVCMYVCMHMYVCVYMCVCICGMICMYEYICGVCLCKCDLYVCIRGMCSCVLNSV